MSEKDFINIISLSSAHGFNDTDVLSLISYLGSKGVVANYRSSGVGIESGAMTNYLIRVAPGDVEYAEELLREYFSESK